MSIAVIQQWAWALLKRAFCSCANSNVCLAILYADKIEGLQSITPQMWARKWLLSFSVVQPCASTIVSHGYYEPLSLEMVFDH